MAQLRETLDVVPPQGELTQVLTVGNVLQRGYIIGTEKEKCLLQIDLFEKLKSGLTRYNQQDEQISMQKIILSYSNISTTAMLQQFYLNVKTSTLGISVNIEI